MIWTDEMIEGLRQMWKKGLTANEIAKTLGVSKNSIVGKVHRLNLTARPSPIKRKSEDENQDEQVSVQAENFSKKFVITPIEINNTSMVAPSSEQNGCLPLTELDNHTCRWPIGDPRDEGFCFCGKKVKSGQTYCEEHAAMAYVKPIKKV